MAFKRMPTSALQNARTVTTMVNPLLAYGICARDLNAARVRSWRHQILVSVHGRVVQGRRCAEVLLGVLAKL